MIHLITGKVHGGKTSLLKEVVARLKKNKIPMVGFLSEAVINKGKHTGYDLMDVKTEKRSPFIRTQGDPDWPRSGRFFFVPAALEQAKNLIHARKDLELLIVDEVGPLEMRGRGLWPALERALFPDPPECLFVIRKKIAQDFTGKLNTDRVKVYDIQNPDLIADLTERIDNYMNRAE